MVSISNHRAVGLPPNKNSDGFETHRYLIWKCDFFLHHIVPAVRIGGDAIADLVQCF